MNHYTEFVRSRVKSPELIVKELKPREAHLWHMATGVCGEVGEILSHYRNEPLYKNENLIKECGDIEFYLEGYVYGLSEYDASLQIDRKVAKYDINIPWVDYFVEETSALLEITKKHVIFHKKLNVQLLAQKVENIHSSLNALYYKIGTIRSLVVKHNIYKLTKRYENGYSDSAAIARVDVK